MIGLIFPLSSLTAKGEKHDIHRGSLLGADVYLTKPFDAEDLLVAVKSRLKSSRRRKKVGAKKTRSRNIRTQKANSGYTQPRITHTPDSCGRLRRFAQ